MKHTTQIGIISDTHGLLRPEAIAALQQSDLILHAGDIGKPEILEELRAIAPVVAIRGNNDQEEWAAAIPERELIQLETTSIYMLHDVNELDPTLTKSVQVVVSGHSHKPSIATHDGILFINPGSAGRRRFKLPISLARLQICDRSLNAEIIELTV